jgi:uncharacterized protein
MIKNMHLSVSASIFYMLLSLSPASADFDLGMKAYIAKNYNLALRELTASAKDGHSMAQGIVGLMYSRGHGVERSFDKAVYWLEKAAKQGEVGAQFQLGMKYYLKRPINPEHKVPMLYWLSKAAEKNHTLAQEMLGMALLDNAGVNGTTDEALEWLARAGFGGSARAQEMLGSIYRGGRITKRNYVKAHDWYLMAAQQNLPASQWTLGYMYIAGEGVKKDFLQAKYWINNAAENGHGEAQLTLGTFAFLGTSNTERNLVVAYKWYAIAYAFGVIEAQRMKSVVSGEMTKGDIAEAEGLADEWIKLHELENKETK